MATATRELRFLLAVPERRVLRALAARVPAGLRPNHFTVFGTMAAVGTGVAYAMTTYHPGWLWVASLMLAVNWLGDSLDGTLARVRKAERPRYGYYLDHIVDAFSTIAIGIGLGLSPYVDFALATGLVLVYLVLSINVYLESSVFGVFQLDYGRLGPTEVRLLLIVINTVLALVAHAHITSPAAIESVVSRVLLVMLIGMVAMLVLRFARNLTNLAKLEPQFFRRSRHGAGADGLPLALEIMDRAAHVESAIAAAQDRRGRGATDAPFIAARRSSVEPQRVTDDDAG